MEANRNLIGIDKNWKKDVFLIGLPLGIGFIVLSSLNNIFALGFPKFAFSFTDTARFLIINTVAPAGEEGFFRGFILYLFWGLLRLPFAIANTIQGIAFAVYHFFVYGLGLLAAFFAAFIFGIIAGFVAKKTNSQAGNLTGHHIINLFDSVSKLVVVA